MQINGLTIKELAARWGCSVKTVRRNIRAFGLEPAAFTGICPLFTLDAIERMEKRRHAARRKQQGYE